MPAELNPPPRGTLNRYVAIGDSFTEGLDDLRADGTPRGWADRVADVLNGTEEEFRYSNLAIRGLRLDAIIDEQIPAAVAMRPDLVTIAGGGNDILGLRVDVDRLAARFDDGVAMLTGWGAVTVVFAGFDPRTQLPLGRLIAARVTAFNAEVKATANRHGAMLIDLWSMPELADARMWSRDRLHLSTAGHLHIAGVVLDRLGRPTPPGWPVHLGAARTRSRLRSGVDEVTWTHRDLLPWVNRKLRGRTSGDGRTAKQPTLEPWVSTDDLDGSDLVQSSVHEGHWGAGA